MLLLQLVFGFLFVGLWRSVFHYYQCFKGEKVTQGKLGAPGRLGDKVLLFPSELAPPGCLSDIFKTLIITSRFGLCFEVHMYCYVMT